MNAPESIAGPGVSRRGPHRILVLGLGNDILSDDAVGLLVAAAVRERLGSQSGISVVESGETGLALLDLIVGFDSLVIVDAVQTEKAVPGFVHVMEGTDLETLPAVSPHFLGIGEMLALGKALGMAMPKRVLIFAIEVKDPFTIGHGLTSEVQSALFGVVDKVLERLAGLEKPAAVCAL